MRRPAFEPARRGGVAIVLIALAGCGRLNFEATGDAPGDGRSGDGAPGDGSTGDGTGAGDGGPCTNDLSNVGLGDFEVAFTIQTTSTTRQAVLFQRAICAGSAGHWDLYLGEGPAAGMPILEVHEGGSTAQTNASIVVNDGAPHVVVFERLGGFLRSRVDGQSLGGQTVPLALASLPALGVATGHPCAGTPALVGAVTAICVRPL